MTKVIFEFGNIDKTTREKLESLSVSLKEIVLKSGVKIILPELPYLERKNYEKVSELHIR
jgi:hypothetical protein